VLFEIETGGTYRIALESAQAQAQRDGAAARLCARERDPKASLAKEGWTSTDIYQQTTSTLHQSEGVVALDKAAVAKAQLDLSRTAIRSPVNGYVTNLLAQLGDYATVGQKLISSSTPTPSGSTATSRRRVSVGSMRVTLQPPKLMGYSQLVHGHVAASLVASTSRTHSAGSGGARLGKSNLHLGAPCSTRAGNAFTSIQVPDWRPAGGRNDGYRPDRSHPRASPR